MDSERQQRERLSSVRLFYSYAQEDEKLLDQLAKHLSVLRRERLIEERDHRQIVAGIDWSQALSQESLWTISPELFYQELHNYVVEAPVPVQAASCHHAGFAS